MHLGAALLGSALDDDALFARLVAVDTADYICARVREDKRLLEINAKRKQIISKPPET